VRQENHNRRSVAEKVWQKNHGRKTVTKQSVPEKSQQKNRGNKFVIAKPWQQNTTRRKKVWFSYV
jgi:hypothetical protein